MNNKHLFNVETLVNLSAYLILCTGVKLYPLAFEIHICSNQTATYDKALRNVYQYTSGDIESIEKERQESQQYSTANQRESNIIAYSVLDGQFLEILIIKFTHFFLNLL
jgi:hypothetical protein